MSQAEMMSQVVEEEDEVLSQINRRSHGSKRLETSPFCIARDCRNPHRLAEIYHGEYVEIEKNLPFGALIFETRDSLIRRGYYIHSKTGRLYNVLGVVRIPGSDKYSVLYTGLYYHEEFGDNCYWFRSLKDFSKTIKVPGGEKAPRFQYRGF